MAAVAMAPVTNTVDVRDSLHRQPHQTLQAGHDGLRRCPHKLSKLVISGHDWYCSKCDRDLYQGEEAYGCWECNYDECMECRSQSDQVDVIHDVEHLKSELNNVRDSLQPQLHQTLQAGLDGLRQEFGSLPQQLAELKRQSDQVDLTTMEFQKLRQQIFDRGLLAPPEDAHATTQKKATHDIFNVLGVSEPFEFTDTDGDKNRLEMIDQEMYWFEPDGIGAWIRRGQCGRCTFQKSSGQITCENAEATLKEEDIEEFVRVLVATRTELVNKEFHHIDGGDVRELRLASEVRAPAPALDR